MNVVVVIGGREAIPVRAIPFLTIWNFVTPVVVAKLLADDESLHGFASGNLVTDEEAKRGGVFRGIQAFHLDDGKVLPIGKAWWAGFPVRDLRALEKEIQATEPIPEIGEQRWRNESLRLLPAGAFVWKDDYQELHDKNWNDRSGMIYRSLRDWNSKGNKDESDEEIEARIQRKLTREELVDDTPLKRDLRTSLKALKRWRKPDYSPFMRSEQYAVVMEGFEPSDDIAPGRADADPQAEAPETPANKPQHYAAAGPVFSMSRTALVEKHRQKWPTIERDLKDAATNGLSAAKAHARDWKEDDALAWAASKNKLASKPADALAEGMHSMVSLPGRKHTQGG